MEILYNIIDKTKEKQLAWYGHVRRLREERLPREDMEEDREEWRLRIWEM